MTRKMIRIAAVAVFGFLAAGASANASAGWVGPLSGTWEIHGTPDPANVCGVSEFTNLTSVTRDGKFVNVDPDVGTGVGEAYRTGRWRYAVGFFGFIPAGDVTLRYEVQGSLRLLDRSHFIGQFRTTIYDPAWNPVCEYEGTIEGFRQVPIPY